MKFLFCSLFFITNADAFYLECKNVSDNKVEVRIFQNNNNSNDLFLIGQTHTNGTPVRMNIKMDSSKILYYPFNKIHTINWINPKGDLMVNINISENHLEDGREIEWPISYQSVIKINFLKDGLTFIDSDSFACRQFMNE